MRSIFASDKARVDYGLAHPRLTRAGRLCVALLALAIAGIGVGNVNSEIGASSEPGSVVDRVAPIFGIGRTSVPATKPPQTVGFAPIGVADRFMATDRFTTAESWPGAAADSAIPRQAQTTPAGGEVSTPIDRTPKLDEKSQVAKKKPVRSASADGRHGHGVGASPHQKRRRQAESADFVPWDIFMSVPRPGRRVHIARPGPFGAPL
jgi:hypothetical protein